MNNYTQAEAGQVKDLEIHTDLKLHITKANLLHYNDRSSGLERFDTVYPDVDDNQQIELLDIAENDMFETTDVIWALRATVENSKDISVAFAQACAARAAAYYAACAAAEASDAATDATDAVEAADAAADAADYAADAAAYAVDTAAERKAQREHLIQLLQEN